jgi:glutamate dehydrogenase (NAD(P)+)
LQQFFWSEDEVNTRLVELMQRAFQQVVSTAEKEHESLRTAALMLGIGRVAKAKRLRGVFP